MDVFSLNKAKINRQELLLLGCICFLYFIFVLIVFVCFKRTFSHDTMWQFGGAHYFYNCLMNGVFPYWDIYNYCGGPFYYNIGILRLLEITTFPLVFIFKFFNLSLFSLYHLDFLTKIFLYALGVYFAMRKVSKYTLSGLFAFFVFIFSTFTFVSFRQSGVFVTFAWTAWGMWFLMRLLEDKFNIYNMVGFCFFLGLSLNSYQGAYVLTFMQFFFLSLLFNRKAYLLSLIKDRKNRRIFLIGVLVISGLFLHTLAVFIEKDKNIAIMRQMYQGTSVPIMPADYLGLFFPGVAAKFWNSLNCKQYFSECAFYIGIIPLLLSVWGMVSSRHKFRFNFIFVLMALVLVSINLQQYLGWVKYLLLPFLIYARNMEIFQPFVIFVLVYFCSQGADDLIQRLNQNKDA
ncbi:MAG: hypothetical protein MUF05_03750 [Candidatus Omnitrophica bacterium]|jgi:hypothetical protein|nr:hypothetical protein [Candidatus Omnitrophota bacterium]